MRELIDRIPREVKLVILGTLGVSVLAVLITVAVFFMSREPVQPARSVNPDIQSGNAVRRVDPSEFIIPDERETSIGTTYAVYRFPRTRWSAEEIKEFWTDPAELSVEILAAENRDLVLSILELEGQ